MSLQDGTSHEQQSLDDKAALPTPSITITTTGSSPASTHGELQAIAMRGPSDVLAPRSSGSEFTEPIEGTRSRPGMADMSTPSPMRLLQPKNAPPARTMLINKLISQVMCSFPERTFDGASYPPFIHQSTFRQSASALRVDDPIRIYQAIRREFNAGKPQNDISFWDSVASEQERIYRQRASLDRWLCLSSTQALTIYLLMLAAKGESALAHHPNLAITILFSMGTLFGQLHKILPGYVTAEERIGGKPVWQDWLFAESKLRTATVYFILSLHFNVEFGLPCDRERDTTFEEVELPAAKILWEAQDEATWSEKFDMVVERRDVTIYERSQEARLKYDDLIRYNKRQCGYDNSATEENASRLAERIEKWHKEIDELGMLVALCGTMI